MIPPDPIALTPAGHHLWLTSRSAFERGTQFCPYARYVEYHAGPYGYGLQRKALSVPLATGTYIHFGLALICQWILDARLATGAQPDEAPDEVIRWAATAAVDNYTHVVNKRGLLTLESDDPDVKARLDLMILEQQYLIEGLIWAWCLTRLPAYLREYLIVAVEQEEMYVLDCTCGVGTGLGTVADHEARGCAGKGLQSRPDILGERKTDHAYAYTEFKTTSQARREWNDSWQRKQQFLIGIAGAETRLGVEITHAWVEGLIKGQRKRDYPYSAEMPKRQQSMLVYGFFAPGSTGVDPRWRPSYNYRDREGVEFTAGKKEGYRKTALWEAAEAWPGLPDGMRISEYWTKTLLADHPYDLAKCVSLIGPLPKQREQLVKAMRSFSAEEELWQDRLWKIYSFSQETGKEWGDEEFMQFVETVVPRSWNCDPFGPDHPCQHQVVCHAVTDDYKRPIESGLYVYRSPHHEAEAEQMAARGLKPEKGLAEELDEMEGEDG